MNSQEMLDQMKCGIKLSYTKAQEMCIYHRHNYVVQVPTHTPLHSRPSVSSCGVMLQPFTYMTAVCGATLLTRTKTGLKVFILV